MDRVRIARLLRFRPVEVANRNVFAALVEALVPDHIVGFRMLDDAARLLLDLGRPPLDYVDECVTALLSERQLSKVRATSFATRGMFGTPLRVATADREQTRSVDVHYQLALEEAPPEPAIPLSPPAEAEAIDIPVEELHALATRLDDEFEQEHRTQAVAELFAHLETQGGEPINDVWQLRAGPTQVFQAPTGSGKNVLAELVACWCATHDRVASLVVPTNATVVKTAYSIERSLRALGSDAEVVPLTSPNSAQTVAETTVRGAGPDGVGLWAMDRLAYGCTLPSAAVSEESVDAWNPGNEPCGSLRKIGGDGRLAGTRNMCPWKPSCGKYRNVRQACTASVIVTSHVNWLVGTLHVPVEAQGRVEDNMSVEELLLHRSDLVLIDEIDAFQAAMISRSARGLLLAHRRRRAFPPPLRRLDNELHDATGRLDGSVEHHVRAATAHARFLAENYTSHLSEGAFRRQRRGRKSPHPMQGRWLLPRKWDAWLAATLFNIPDGEQPRREHYKALQGLFPDEGDPTLVPDWLLPVRAALAQVTSLTAGDDAFQPAWNLIYETLRQCPYTDNRLSDDESRIDATDRLIRRAYLERLRALLFRFVYAAPQLQASGVTAAREIAEALGQYATWCAAPYGPLGRSLFAFTEHYDRDRPNDTVLKVNAFGGDPHSYVTSLGEVTALAHLGLPRAVVGLSATSYFPAAPHHHVFAKPTWWVADDYAGTLKIRASPISDQERDFVRVSGTHGQTRTDVLTNLGELLWKKRLAPALLDLAANPETTYQQRLLLATTSYQGARDLAEGIANAGVSAERVVVAVPADDRGRRESGRWIELPADQLESFDQEADGSVLIAPLARAQRGLNIVDHQGRSLIGSVWLVVRPLPIMDEPSEILAHVHARARTAVLPNDHPTATLDIMRQVAGRHFDELFTALPYFSTLPSETQLAIVAETLNGLIQLAGRARRGGATGEIHLVDYAFLDERGHSDLPNLIARLRQHWQDEGQLDLMRRLYGRTLDEIFTFADNRENIGDDE
ncbi:MAG: hypothetical protein GEU98_08855 [Pseudonocardiaceae bacterium]|nr:hypothetical protein [Pseudonocardiaceae bacterium]